MNQRNHSNSSGSADAVVLDRSREGSPEPTLLPHLAHSIPYAQLPWLLDAADTIGRGGVAPAWPRLLSATCAITARRMTKDPGNEINLQMLESNSELYSHVDTAMLELALRTLTPATDRWLRKQRFERICRLANHHPAYRNGVLVDFASAAWLDLDSDQALQAGAWFLPLTEGSERRELMDALLPPDWSDLQGSINLFKHADQHERDRLMVGLLTFLDEHDWPEMKISIIANVLPAISGSGRDQLLKRLLDAIPLSPDNLPSWWLALVCSRISAVGTQADIDFDRLPTSWQTQMNLFQGLPANSDYADVMRAYPGAAAWMAEPVYPGLSSTQAAALLDEIMSFWSGSEVSMRPSPEAENAVSETSSPPVTTPLEPPPSAEPEGVVSAPPDPRESPVHEAPAGPAGIFERMLSGIFDRGSTPNSEAESATRGPPGGQPEPQMGRRLQADVKVLNQSGNTETSALTRAFVAGHRHQIELSVGRGASLQLGIQLDGAVFAVDSDVVTLDLRLIYQQQLSSGSVDLPKDSSRNSGVWTAALDVPVGTEKVEASVVVLQQGRVLQTAKLSGITAPSFNAANQSDGKITFTVSADVHDFSGLEQRTTFDASIITDGSTGAAFAADSVGIRDLKGVDATIARMTDKLFKTSEAVTIAGSQSDPTQYEKLLVFLAANGKVLHSMLIRQLMPSLDDARRIQIVSTNPSAMLPLEFIYSGPSPKSNARLCDGWQQALEQGICPSCGQLPADERSATICPLHFWALSKIIERHALGKPRVEGHDFYVDSGAAGRRGLLDPLQTAVFAASDNVPEEMVDATLEVLNANVASCVDARSWDDWTQSIENNSPSLLVSMPHNALDPILEISTLEIGRGDELRAGEVTSKFVRNDASTVGPIVLLLGCQTAVGGPQPFHTFVGEFRHSGAAIVIGTLATVLGEHAAPVVQAIVQELSKPAAAGENTIGDLLLRIRRKMFAQGILIGLAVAAFGDADWALAAVEE